jgi:hypothetical protein
MSAEPPSSVPRLDAPPPPPTLADVADLVLFCGYVEEGKRLPFLTSSLYNDRQVFLVTHAVHYGRLPKTRLHYLVKKGNVDKLRSVIESAHGGLDLTVRDYRNWTLLHCACELSHPTTSVAVATVLLDAGADPWMGETY